MQNDKIEIMMLKNQLIEVEQEIKAKESELEELHIKAREIGKKIEDKQKDEIFSALIASGKTVEEVITYLKSGRGNGIDDLD